MKVEEIRCQKIERGKPCLRHIATIQPRHVFGDVYVPEVVDGPKGWANYAPADMSLEWSAIAVGCSRHGYQETIYEEDLRTLYR